MLSGWSFQMFGKLAHVRSRGDVVLARKEAPTSYHLAVAIDDALQGVTEVVRGQDLFCSTSIHRLLQALLGLPEPLYHHHKLILDPGGRKLSIRDLAEQLQVRHHSTVGIVDQLVLREAVVREVAPDDRRKILLSLTEKGEEIVQRLAPPHHKALSRLCPEMIETLQRICAEQ